MFSSFTLAITNHNWQIKAEMAEILRFLYSYTRTIGYKKWSNLELLVVISLNYGFSNLDTSLYILKDAPNSLWAQRVNEANISDNQINKLNKLRRTVKSTIESVVAQNIVSSKILEVGNYFYLLCCYTNLSFSSLID
jgi:hypothetical protein